MLVLALALVQLSSKAVQWMLEVGSFYRNYSNVQKKAKKQKKKMNQ
jgi:hypothetical protein